MNLAHLIPDPDVLVALEPDELGLRLLPWIASFSGGNRQLQLALQQANESYPGRGHAHVGMAIREAWAWLEGQGLIFESPQYVSPHAIRVLSRKAAQLATQHSAQLASVSHRVPKAALHPLIREDVWGLYHRGKYDTAVFEAMKAVEVSVRHAANLTHRDVGVALMRKAFDKATGPLSDMSMEEGEREARAHLFAGAMGSYKNPHSHRNVVLDDPDEAAEIIMLANHLLRIVDSRAVSTATALP